MKIKSIITFLMCCVILLSPFQLKNCHALSLSEQYECCFEEKDCEDDIIIHKTTEADKEILKSILINEGEEFTRYIGGFETKEDTIYDLLNTKENELSLTIENSNNIVGQILISYHGQDNKLDITYWIGKDFRGNRYAYLATSRAMSRIWKVNSDVSFEFEIDDENTSSIKTLQKICKELNIDFNNPDSQKESHTVEIIANKNDDEASTYDLQLYVDNTLIDSRVFNKEDLLKKHSQDKLDSGVLFKSSSSIYLIKCPDRV